MGSARPAHVRAGRLHRRAPAGTHLRIVVAGASGRIGARLVALLEARGHDVVRASRRTGVDLATGEGVADAVAGADAVVDVTRPPSVDAADVLDFFAGGTRRLLDAEPPDSRHVVLSVVGAARLAAGGSGFMAAKIAQERLVEASDRPHTIVAATQFFEFAKGIADHGRTDDGVVLPDVDAQPVAADDVAALLAEVTAAAPRGRVELAGPERMALAAFVERVTVDAVRTDPDARYFGAVVARDTLLPGPEARLGETTLDAWLATHPHAQR